MKRSILALAACTLITGATIVSCQSSETKVENAKEDVIDAAKDLEQANQEYLAEIEIYRQEMMKEIEANDQAIADMESKAAKEGKSADTKRKEKVAELKRENSEMRAKLQDYKADGKDAWENFKAEFNHDMKESGNAFKDIGVNNVKE